LKVKICGITNIEDALLCEGCGADLLGFIFYNKSKRFIPFEDAGKIISKLSPLTNKVGVFVNENVEIMNKAADSLKLDFLQLHGDEEPGIVHQLERKVIKAFGINDSFDFSTINRFENVIPLLDSHSKEKYGGTGTMFNWDIIPNSIWNKIILAGGVSSENVEYIYRQLKPLAVDVSSSLEISPGIKDKNKVKEFFIKIEQLRSSKW